ncbi:MAG: alpha/beta hydrolase [Pirellulaceae bacterium]|nr:alpha/beta hydrolase [Pirellulaceae bacterium]
MTAYRLRNIMLLAVGHLLVLHAPADAEPFPGKQSVWNGYQRFDFVHQQRRCIVVTPRNAAKGKPWIWRARFFGHEPQADLVLLKRGFHLAYCDVANLYGSPAAVEHWNRFYQYLTRDHQFSTKVALEGMSRGGLIIYNWAAANPEKVSCIYGDAPVCDFKSWPGGKGSGKGSAGSWQTCLKAYGLTEAAALKFRGNPIDQLAPLAKMKIPLLHVVGASDQVVPVAENTTIIQQRFQKLGGQIEVISKPGIGHHPHSLKDPTRIVQFILRHTGQPTD